MSPQTGDIFLDPNFPMRTGNTKSIYLVVLAETPFLEDSVLFARAEVLPEPIEIEGPDWMWPERFRIAAHRTPLDEDFEIFIDDVYQGKSLEITQRCEHLGQLDAMVSSALLRALSDSIGIAGVHCNRFLQIADQIAPPLQSQQQ